MQKLMFRDRLNGRPGCEAPSAVSGRVATTEFIMKRLFVLGFALWTGAAQAQGCGATPLPQPFAGKSGAHVDVYQPSDATMVVSSAKGLVTALQSVSPGDVIYVSDDAEIDLTSAGSLEIPAHVTLASGRGRRGSEGALLYTENQDARSFLQVEGTGVRFTGLRIRGPDQEIGKDVAVYSIGIRSDGDYSFEVDNSELYGWTYGAVLVTGGNAHVHHNYIHHNRRHGLGYGVVLHEDSRALIENNVFNANRHSIAGTGAPGQSYEARYNLVGPTASSHVFDMHGGSDYEERTDNISGDTILIHHNTVIANATAVYIRGVPETGAWIYDNDFRHVVAYGSQAAIKQRHDSKERIWYAGNCYMQTGWYFSPAANGFWGSLAKFNVDKSELRFGDFDGDGKTDVFHSDGRYWRVSYGAISDWSRLNKSGTRVDQLAFADFDGDGKTDVFRAGEGRWFVSYGGATSWTVLKHSDATNVHTLRFGDFDGDGKADVFRADGQQWLVSFGGTSDWSRLAALSAPVDELAFADFDGDGKTDVFRASGSQWLVSYGGLSEWRRLSDSPTMLGRLVLADVNGDGSADVVHTTGSYWMVSYGGISGLQKLAASKILASELGVGDFDGDQRADLFRAGTL